ncbi:MAG: hypothetical protein R2882_11360 [Gemmatimonadales bacterium]
MAEPRSSRRRYLRFAEDYRAHRIDDTIDGNDKPADARPTSRDKSLLRGQRRSTCGPTSGGCIRTGTPWRACSSSPCWWPGSR